MADYYAKPAATGTGSGLSWANANTLQGAAASMSAGDTLHAIRGTYPLTSTLALVANGTYYGGYDPTSPEASPSLRDLTQPRSLLDGMTSPFVGRALSLSSGDTTLDGWEINNDGSTEGVKVMLLDNASTPIARFDNCDFFDSGTGNYSNLFDVHNGRFIFTNCRAADYNTGGFLIANNDGTYRGDNELWNCTILGNPTGFPGHVLASEANAVVVVTNSILREYNFGANGLYTDGGTITITYSNHEGGSGTGVIDSAPTYVNRGSQDLRLAAGSAGIDAGNGTVAPTLDAHGLPRYDDASTSNTGTGTPAYVDMGAHEYQGPTGNIAGAAAGSATTTGAIAGSGAIAGTAAGSATTTGAIAGLGSVSGTVAGSSSVTGAIAGISAVAGTAAGSATVTGAVVGAGAIAGTASGAATTAGAISGNGAVSGTAAGSSTVTGAVSASAGISGTAAGTSTATGGVTGLGAVAGASTGSATATGAVGGTGAIAGTAAGSSTATGAVFDGTGISGVAAGTSTATGSISGVGAIAGAAAGSATASATVGGIGAVAGSAAGTSTAAGTLASGAAISGTAAGTSTATGTIGGAGAVAGAATGSSSAAGDVFSGTLLLSGTASGSSTATGTITGIGAIAGTAAGTSTASWQVVPLLMADRIRVRLRDSVIRVRRSRQ